MTLFGLRFMDNRKTFFYLNGWRRIDIFPFNLSPEFKELISFYPEKIVKAFPLTPKHIYLIYWVWVAELSMGKDVW